MISATVLADSITNQGHRLTTLKIVMPRYILAEFNTHRMISKNSASSRAIPFKKMVESVKTNPFIPSAWQKDHSGMQGHEYYTEQSDIEYCQRRWREATQWAITCSEHLHGDIFQIRPTSITKQLCNRVMEPYMWHTVICTATEWENFFNLRCPSYFGKYRSWSDWFRIGKPNRDVVDWYDQHPIEKFKANEGQADIHIMELAECIWDAMNISVPTKIQPGGWHIPYGDNIDVVAMYQQTHGQLSQYGDLVEYTGNCMKDMIKVSTARCARISYETLGDNPKIDYAADIKLHDRLLKSDPLHASPGEHQGRVMTDDEYIGCRKTYLVQSISQDILDQVDNGMAEIFTWSETNKGVTTMVTEFGWCRNLRGFIQYRHLLENNMDI